MSELFSPEQLRTELKKLPELPAEQAGVGVVATSDDIGIRGEVNKDIGKPGGWFVMAEGSWMKRAGGSVAGWIGWKGKSS